MLTAPQLGRYYPDLADESFASALALVHSRFSTNTFPSWELAHPYRMIAHNGEINTLRGNVNWMRARESQLASELFGDDLQKVLPVVRPGGSDTATFDNVLELLVLAGRSLPHALMMMIPEAYAGRDDVSDDLRGFYAFHECLMEAWDGPAAIAFTDGRVIGATLDRNGLRPGRWLETRRLGRARLGDGRARHPRRERRAQGRLQPGKLFLVDLEQGRIVPDESSSARSRRASRTRRGSSRSTCGSPTCRAASRSVPRASRCAGCSSPFGYAQEDMKVMLAPLAANAEEAVGSMGNDTPLAVLSNRRPLLYSYFKQLFAQVTNPPIDSIREAVVMSVQSSVGSERNLLDETPAHARQLVIENPILRNHELESLRQVDSDVFKAHTIDTTWPVEEGVDGLEKAVERICAEADDALAGGANILILSDRAMGPTRVAMPSLLAVGAVHHHLVRAGTRLQAGLVVESGEPRSVHSVAVLIGLRRRRGQPVPDARDDLRACPRRAARARRRGSEGARREGGRQGPAQDDLEDGHLDDLVLLRRADLRGGRPSTELVDKHFTGTPSRIGGIGLAELAEGALLRHARAYPGVAGELLPVVGLYAWRRDGEHHQWNPRRSRSCSTRCAAAAPRPTSSTPPRSTRTPRAARRCAA